LAKIGLVIFEIIVLTDIGKNKKKKQQQVMQPAVMVLLLYWQHLRNSWMSTKPCSWSLKFEIFGSCLWKKEVKTMR